MNELEIGAGAAEPERHLERVQDQGVRPWAASRQPAIIRLNASMMNAKNSTPSQQRS